MMSFSRLVARLAAGLSLTALCFGGLSTAQAAGNAPQPNICVRACWGARAPNKAISQMAALTRAIVHHTAGSEFSTVSLADSQARMRAIQNYHMDTQGWGDIAYHFLVDKFGNIFEGRAGSMTSLPRGTHDAANTNSFGFTCLGYFHPNVNNVPTAAMMNSLYAIIAWRMPNGWTPYGSPGGTYGNLGNTVGRVDSHRRVVSTACPGDHLHNPYIGSDINAGTIRAEINSRIAGVPPPGDIPLVGDWNGDGVDTIGIYRNGEWHLRNSNSAGPAQIFFTFGLPTDKPVVGDWNGDGIDTPGIVRDGVWHLKNTNDGGGAFVSFAFGLSTDVPLVGDWDGNGADTIGIRRGAEWHLKNNIEAGPAYTSFSFGLSTDTPLVGDWDGNGVDSIAIRRGGDWHLKSSNDGGGAYTSFSFGLSTDVPVVGDWDGNNSKTVGIRRGNVWHLSNTNSSAGAFTSFAYGL